MNDTATALALALGGAWTSGINVYATIAVLGLADAMGAIVLPPELQVLAHPAIITLAIVLYLVEFLADKIPLVDSAWDAVHTFIRVPAGALLAAAALGPTSPTLKLAAYLLGGSVALSAHGAKASVRVALNTSPEPFSNWAASLGEDVLVLTGLWLVFHHPWAMVTFVVVFVAGVAYLAPRIWRALRAMFRRAARWLSGSPPQAVSP